MIMKRWHNLTSGNFKLRNFRLTEFYKKKLIMKDIEVITFWTAPYFCVKKCNSGEEGVGEEYLLGEGAHAVRHCSWDNLKLRTSPRLQGKWIAYCICFLRLISLPTSNILLYILTWTESSFTRRTKTIWPYWHKLHYELTTNIAL